MSAADVSAVSLATLTESSQHIDYEEYIDLKEKYDVLYQEFVTMELEKSELLKELEKMKEKNEALEELEKEEHDKIEEFEQFTKPLLTGSLATMSSALGDADILQESISMQNTDLKDSKNKLQQENIKLRDQNKKYQKKIETMQLNEQKKENEYKHKIELLEAEIENLNTEETDVINKYAKLQDAYSNLRNETAIKLQHQSELSAPMADIGIEMSVDKTVHISSQFVRSSANILSDTSPNISKQNILIDKTPNVSKRNMLQFVEYNSIQSLPELTNYGSNESNETSEYVSATESIEDRAQAIHMDMGQGMEKIDENKVIDKEVDTNNKEMENRIKNMENDIQSKDNIIEQKNIMIKSDKVKIENKDTEIERLKKQIGKLEKQNNKLQKQNGRLNEMGNDNNDQCFAFKWFT